MSHDKCFFYYKNMSFFFPEVIPFELKNILFFFIKKLNEKTKKNNKSMISRRNVKKYKI